MDFLKGPLELFFFFLLFLQLSLQGSDLFLQLLFLFLGLGKRPLLFFPAFPKPGQLLFQFSVLFLHFFVSVQSGFLFAFQLLPFQADRVLFQKFLLKLVLIGYQLLPELIPPAAAFVDPGF